MNIKVQMYTKANCPYCVMAKKFFSSRNIVFDEVFLDDSSTEYVALKKRTGHLTMPQIFINDQFIGGYSDLVAFESRRELEKLLEPV